MPSLEPELVSRERATIAGIATRTENRLEMDPKTARIGPLWERFFEEGIGGTLSGASIQEGIVAVYTEFESDADGPYSLVIGAIVARSHDVPDSIRTVDVPAGTYLRFLAAGEMPAALMDAWRGIWEYFKSSSHRRSYLSDVETHRTLPNGDVVVEIDIGICE